LLSLYEKFLKEPEININRITFRSLVAAVCKRENYFLGSSFKVSILGHLSCLSATLVVQNYSRKNQ